MSFNLAAHVLARAAAHPDKIALAVLGPTGAARWSYGRLEAAVRGVATGLLSQGAPGDRVLLRLGNTPDFPVAYLGAIAAGLVPIPTSAQLTAPEASAIAQATQPALVLAGDGVALPDHPAPVVPVAQMRAWHDLPPAPYDLGPPERPAYIVFTSGTSGVPRGVVHAHRAILARAPMHAHWLGLGAEDRLLHAGAMNWTYTLGTGLMDPWTLGATALVPGAGVETAQLPLLMKRHDASIFAAVPGVYRQMLRTALPALPRLRHGLSAGEKLPEALRSAWRAATGLEIHEAYGMSECSTFISGSAARPAPPGTLGFAQPGRRIAVLHQGAPAAQGEIAVHRDEPGLMLGYLDQPAETAARMQGDWFMTGDLGHVTPEGAIGYDGRSDDMMNAGGYRVSPLEVEHVLAAHPQVGEAAATEVTVKPGASVIAVFYTGAPLDAAALKAHILARLAPYKCPRIFEYRAALPRGRNHKLDRRALRHDWETRNGHA